MTLFQILVLVLLALNISSVENALAKLLGTGKFKLRRGLQRRKRKQLGDK